MAKQAWRYKAFDENTKIVEEFCSKYSLTLEKLNHGYQLRVGGVIDIYPVRKRWHYLKTGQRGDWEDIEDIDMAIFEGSTASAVLDKSELNRVTNNVIDRDYVFKDPTHINRIQPWAVWYKNPIQWYKQRKLFKDISRRLR